MHRCLSACSAALALYNGTAHTDAMIKYLDFVKCRSNCNDRDVVYKEYLVDIVAIGICQDSGIGKPVQIIQCLARNRLASSGQAVRLCGSATCESFRDGLTGVHKEHLLRQPAAVRQAEG